MENNSARASHLIWYLLEVDMVEKKKTRTGHIFVVVIDKNWMSAKKEASESRGRSKKRLNEWSKVKSDHSDTFNWIKCKSLINIFL